MLELINCKVSLFCLLCFPLYTICWRFSIFRKREEMKSKLSPWVCEIKFASLQYAISIISYIYWAFNLWQVYALKLADQEGRNQRELYLGPNESLQPSVENQKMLIDLNVYCLKAVHLLVACKALLIAPPCDLHSSCSPPHTRGASHPGPTAIPCTCYNCFYFRVLDLTVPCKLKILRPGSCRLTPSRPLRFLPKCHSLNDACLDHLLICQPASPHNPITLDTVSCSIIFNSTFTIWGII